MLSVYTVVLLLFICVTGAFRFIATLTWNAVRQRYRCSLLSVNLTLMIAMLLPGGRRHEQVAGARPPRSESASGCPATSGMGVLSSTNGEFAGVTLTSLRHEYALHLDGPGTGQGAWP
jgi:hypothetical protein